MDMRLSRFFMTFLAFLCVLPAMAADQKSEATKITEQIHRLDVLNQILPVLMTKDQIKKMIVEIEKVRQTFRDNEKVEYDALKKVEDKVAAEVKRSTEKGDLPNEKLMEELGALRATFIANRNKLAVINTANIYLSMKTILNEGQMKAAGNSVDPRYFGVADPEKLAQEDKLRLWIQNVLLDPVSYDVLVELSKKE